MRSWFGAVLANAILPWCERDPKWTFLDDKWQAYKSASWSKCLEANNQVLSQVQKVPNGPKMVPKGQQHVT